MTSDCKCQKCGKSLGAFALGGGMCPACLLLEGVTPSPEEGAATAAAAPGTVRYFGDYELIEEIARGGMGVVYRARQVSLSRTVAVKMILSGQLATAAEVQRFRAESAAAAKLQHPNILGIYEVGEHEGRHYFSMEYVDGRNLAELVKDGPLPAARAAAYVKATAEAIHYAHQKGVLHRDVKPSNVLVDAFDQPRVMDFGLAKQVESGSDLTLSGQVLGTPNFIPPEQAGGRRGEVGPHSDVYGLGAVLCFLLTGRPPFLADSIEATLHAVLKTEPISPRLFNPNVPLDLETICLKCLEKEPARRYASAQELVEELGRFLRDEPIHARPVSRAERTRRWCRRYPAVAALGAVVLVLLSVVAVSSTVYALRLKMAHQQATKRLREAYLGEARADRWSGRPGRRFHALEQLRKAAEIDPSPTLRNEAIACMALVDVRKVREWEVPTEMRMSVDPQFELYAAYLTNGTVAVGRLSDSVELWRVPPFGLRLQEMRFSYDSRLLLVAEGDSHVANLHLYDTHTRQPVWLKTNAWVRNADFSRDNRRLAMSHRTISNSSFVVVHNLVADEEEVRLLLSDLTSGVRFHPDGRRLAVNVDGKGVGIWNLETRRLIQSLDSPSPILSIDWHPNGQWLALGTRTRGAELRHVETGELLRAFTGHQGACNHVLFNSTGELLMSSSWDGSVRLWNVYTGEELLRLSADTGIAPMLSANDRWLILAPTPERRVLYEVNMAPERIRLHFKSNRPPAEREGSWRCSFSPDGRLLVSTHRDGVRLWDVASARQLWLLPGGGESALFHPDGQSLLVCGSGETTLWPLRRTETHASAALQVGPPESTGLPTLKAAFLDQTGQRILGERKGTLRLYDFSSGKEERRWVMDRDIYSSCFSPDGRWCAAWPYEGGPVQVWNVASGEMAASLSVQRCYAVAFSPDARSLLTAGIDEYQMWDVTAWQRLYSYPREGIGGLQPRAAFSPDGRLAAVSDRRSAVRLFNPATGREIARLEPPEDLTIAWLTFSPDSSRVAVTSQGGFIQIWDLRLIRRQLARLKLDWNTPPLPPAPATFPLRLDLSRVTNVVERPLGANIPARDSRCGPKQLDLTAFYNASLLDSWFKPGWKQNNLATLPAGLQTLDGVQFDLRGLVQLAGSHSDLIPGYPLEVTGVRVDQRATALHFLHATGWEPKDGSRVGEYVLRYRDGWDLTVPLVYAQNIRAWSMQADAPVALADGSSVAWRGTNPFLASGRFDAVLYRFHLLNPRPEVEIATLEFRAADTVAAPFLVAITAE